MDFPRTRKPSFELQLTALIDVVFILIIFFMLTTTFMRVESMEVMLPSVGAPAKKTADSSIAQIVLRDDGSITYGQRPVDRADLRATLQTLFQARAEQRVVVLVAGKVSLQSLVNVMDMIYSAGGKNVFIKEAPDA